MKMNEVMIIVFLEQNMGRKVIIIKLISKLINF